MVIKLEKPTIKDLEAYIETFNNQNVTKELIGFKYPLTKKEAKIKLEETILKNKLNNHHEFAIKYKNEFIGLICLEKPTKDKKTYSLGYALNEKYWNKGITSKAIQIILDYGFNILKLEKIIADNDKTNPASGKVLKKSNFKKIKEKKGVIYWEITNK